MPKTAILNEEQIEAICYGKGPLLIIAGAGTGKTTVITERIKHLITEKNINPSEILALTFTEKSAREMEERVDVALPYGYTQMWISTFHAFCDRVLRAEGIHIGLSPSYKLVTESESVIFLRQNLFQLDLEYFRPLGNPSKFLTGLLNHFSRLKDEDISPIEYVQWAQNQKSKIKNQNEKGEKEEIEKNIELAQAYEKYENLKIEAGIMDFSDLISNTLKLFRKRKNILNQYQEKFKYILVDEFQDTNYSQNQLAILLAGDTRNITVVGDDDQAIYRWRGAAISNMIQFRERFPDAKIVTLVKNYRSAEEILDASYTLIQHNNPDRLEVTEKINKRLISMQKNKKGHVELLLADRAEDEADIVVKKIQDLTVKDYDYKDIVILVRANDHGQSFIKAFIRNNIPYQFLGPGQLFHLEEIKDLIAYLKVLYNFEDTASLYRVLSMPIFKLEGVELAALLNLARKKNMSLFEVLQFFSSISEDKLKEETFITSHTVTKLKKICELIKNHLNKIVKESAGQVLYYFIQETGYLENMSTATSDDDIKKYQNIAKFFEKLKSFESENESSRIESVIEWIDLAMQMGESPNNNDTEWSENNAVNILTVHSSKGLEFPVVFIVNLVSQRFPLRDRKEQIPIPQELVKEILPSGDFHTQEERRLFYVAMTRAKHKLFLTAANYYGEGKRERKISPFVIEALGEDNFNKIVAAKKEASIIIQPSLLDWVSDFKKPENSITLSNPEERKARITYLSYSQIQCFEICPLHYKLRYILRIPPFPTPAQSFGISLHATLRDIYQEWLVNKHIDSTAISSLLSNNWIPDGYTSKLHMQEALKKAESILENYIANNFHPETSKPIGLEVPFSFFIEHPEKKGLKMKLGGRIDRIDQLPDGKIDIIDYKTGSNMPSEKDLLTHMQLTLYALAATKIRDTIPLKKPEDITLSLHYLETNIILTTSRTNDQLIETPLVYFQKAEEIANSDYQCSKGMLCRNCEYQMMCNTKG